MKHRTPLAHRLSAIAIVIIWGAAVVAAAGNGPGDFTKNWKGRRVVVRNTLYTVQYDEVGRMGRHYRGKMAGLTVATATDHHYEFDGPGETAVIKEETPNRVFDQMSVGFNRAYHLDIGTVKTITPLLLKQYDPGSALIVDSVNILRDRIRFDFRHAEHQEDGFATSLTVVWPVPFSKSFGEREEIERVLHRFVEPM